MQIRKYDSVDRTQVVSLMNRCGIAKTEEEFERELDEPGERTRDNMFVAEIDGQIVGDLRLCFVDSSVSGHVTVFTFGETDPVFTSQKVELLLYEQGLAHLKMLAEQEEMRVDVIRNVHTDENDLIVALHRCGFEPSVRILGMMQDPLLVHDFFSVPTGFVIRPASASDADAVAAVNNDAFAWRTDVMTKLTAESVRYEMEATDCSPDLYPVVQSEAGGVVGFAHCTVDDCDDVRVGRVETIAVSSDVQGMGLGKALLHACLQQFANRGVQRAVLSVESDNPSAALHLYESVGFRNIKEIVRYKLAIDHDR